MKLPFVLLLTILLLTNCKKQEVADCLPDIVGEVVLQDVLTIISGMPLDITINIDASCGSTTTDIFKNELIVEKDTSGNNDYAEVMRLEFESRFENNDAVTEIVELTLSEPGSYRFGLCLDIDNAIEERDETNNCNL